MGVDELKKIDNNTTLGLTVKVVSTGFFSTYGNLDKVLVEEGEEVVQGDNIAIVGTTAELDASEGSYLHFSVLVGHDSIDPKKVLPNDSH